MAYTKNVWVDQDVQRPKTYEVTNNADGSVTLTDSFGVVTEIGTPVNAVNMNHIEDGVADNDTAISTINGKIPSNASSSNKMAVASDIAAINTALTLKADKTQLHALKGYLDDGELLTDAEGLADVKNYAHSTFDLSKFTVVGSPNITDDGVASGFSANDYLSTINLSSYLSNATKIKIEGDFTSPQFPLGNSYEAIIGVANTSFLTFQQYSANTNIQFTPNGGTNYAVIQNVSPNTKYDFYIEITSSSSVLGLRINGQENYITQTVGVGLDFSLISSIVLGKATWGIPLLTGGSINLKQFSITVDGVPVFSGNRTGLDTIKPDDYTVVGTPTISADGVASGFTTSDYLTKSSAFTVGSDGKFNIDFKLNWTQSSSIQYIFDAYINNQNEITIRRNANGGVISLLVFSGGTALLNQAITPVKTDSIVGSFGYNGTHYYWVINGTTYGGGTNTKPAAGTYNLSLGVRSASGTNMDALTTGNLDLNAFKVNVDGDLVYQPLLRIPYTESKTGSKIVDSIYRDRVNDMAEQFGYANYYTLSDTDFTLPQVELYGMYEKYRKQTLSDMMPDYSNAITISSPYTAPSSGVITWQNSATTNCTVNGTTVYIGGNDNSNEGFVFLPVCEDDLVAFTVDSGVPRFIPFKGV